jgi:hypothetical protein
MTQAGRFYRSTSFRLTKKEAIAIAAALEAAAHNQEA